MDHPRIKLKIELPKPEPEDETEYECVLCFRRGRHWQFSGIGSGPHLPPICTWCTSDLVTRRIGGSLDRSMSWGDAVVLDRASAVLKTIETEIANAR